MKTFQGADFKKSIWIAIWTILALSAIVYGILVRLIGSGTQFYLVWLGMGLAFFLLAFAAKKEVWSKMNLASRKVILGILAVGILSFVITDGFIASAFHNCGSANLDYIIVLGAQVKTSGPSAALQYRLDKAIEYLNQNPNTMCIVTGGQGYNEPYAEAVGMSEYLKKHGITDERILVEEESRTTEENFSNSKMMLSKDAKVGVVTNDFHMFRALQIARQQGFEQIQGISAGSSRFFLANNMLREFLAEMKYLVKTIVT